MSNRIADLYQVLVTTTQKPNIKIEISYSPTTNLLFFEHCRGAYNFGDFDVFGKYYFLNVLKCAMGIFYVFSYKV